MIDDAAIAHLRTWIGREERATDVLTRTLVERFCATLPPLGAEIALAGAAPRLLHFCLCQPAAPIDALGADGHPARGGFLPPVPLPRRMWAGSDIRFAGDLVIGDTVERASRIADVAVKQGRTGTLCFITVDHRFTGTAGGVVHDRQRIVYRGPEDRAAATVPDAAPAGDRTIEVETGAPLLFRYSALTFNGHRIHYDEPYAVGVEGYPGLVVHGPLQATLLFRFATATTGGTAPTAFSFRSVSTLFSGTPIRLAAAPAADGALALWTAHAGGPVAMQAEARWM